MDYIARDKRLTSIASSQAGVFTRKQAADAGFGTGAIKLRIAQGRWQPIHPNVYRFGESPPTMVARSRAALLHCGESAALSHLTAAALYGIDVRVPSSNVYVTVPQYRSPRVRAGVVVTRSRTMEGHVTTYRGLPVMTFARTVVDIGHIVDEEAMYHILYDVVRSRRATIQEIAAANERVERRAGCAMLRDVLATFDSAYESRLEDLAAKAMKAAGLSMTPQIEVFANGRLIARLDFGDPESKVAVEIDGSSHSAPDAVAKDKRRDRGVAAEGWLTLRFTAEDVLHRPEAMIREIKAAIAARRLAR